MWKEKGQSPRTVSCSATGCLHIFYPTYEAHNDDYSELTYLVHWDCLNSPCQDRRFHEVALAYLLLIHPKIEPVNKALETRLFSPLLIGISQPGSRLGCNVSTLLVSSLWKKLTAKPCPTLAKTCMLNCLLFSVNISIVLLLCAGSNSLSVLGTEKNMGS